MNKVAVGFGCAVVFATGNGLIPASAQEQQYVISTIAGGGRPPTLITPARGVDLELGGIHDITADKTGSVYTGVGNSVFKLDQNGIVTHFAGTPARGNLVVVPPGTTTSQFGRWRTRSGRSP
jgi:hypothetical protein